MLVHNSRLQRLVGGSFVERGFLALVSRVQLLFLARHKDPAIVRLIRRVQRDRRCLLSAYECWNVYAAARACADLPGDIAEVGVFQGASARLICEVKRNKTFHLFDTFAGLPASSVPDAGVHRLGQYACSAESVRQYLGGFDNLHFYEGLFPETATLPPETRFCFVHLDVDLYQSTLAGLDYFYPRLVPGAVLLSHDYSLLAGVRKAVDEFFADKPETPVELPSTQCMIVKLSDRQPQP
jgi:O-methyltransferase